MSNTTKKSGSLASSKPYRIDETTQGEYWLAANATRALDALVDPGPEAEPEVDPNEGVKVGAVAQLLAGCTPAQREALELHVVQRMSLQEVATELGISKQSVHERIRLALRNARQAAENGVAAGELGALGLSEK